MNPAAEYILSQSEPYKGILLFLQSIIEKNVAGVELKFKYKIPFYYLEGKPFCYLNQAKDYVDLGFWNAAHLSVHLDKLETAGRKVMRSLRYKSMEEIDLVVLEDILSDAISVKDKKFWSLPKGN
ncbi:MAG: DUF1801 domain-containing protein [Flavobacteriaceae bacterium]